MCSMENHFEKEQISPRNALDLVRDFEQKEMPATGEKIRFSAVDGQDVYNISSPFKVDGSFYMAGRIEARDAYADSYVAIFQEENGIWIPIGDKHKFRLEDPFATHIGDDLVFGGVEVYPDRRAEASQSMGFRTVFYRGRDIESLIRFASGPDI